MPMLSIPQEPMTGHSALPDFEGDWNSVAKNSFRDIKAENPFLTPLRKEEKLCLKVDVNRFLGLPEINVGALRMDSDPFCGMLPGPRHAKVGGWHVEPSQKPIL